MLSSSPTTRTIWQHLVEDSLILDICFLLLFVQLIVFQHKILYAQKNYDIFDMLKIGFGYAN